MYQYITSFKKNENATMFIFIKNISSLVDTHIMTSEAAQEDDEALIQKVEDEIDQEIADEVKESTVDYYLKTKDQVMLQLIGKRPSQQ